MTIRERLQALLDGKAIYSSFIRPHRLTDKGFEFLSPLEHWLRTNNLNDLLNPDTKVDIYEELKPEPAQEKRKEFRDKYYNSFSLLDQADAIANYIDERIKELGK